MTARRKGIVFFLPFASRYFSYRSYEKLQRSRTVALRAACSPFPIRSSPFATRWRFSPLINFVQRVEENFARNVARTAAVNRHHRSSRKSQEFRRSKGGRLVDVSGLQELLVPCIRPRAICTFAVSLFFFSARFRR